jgi:alkyldihydroxyacetonephosphate synthase
VKIDRDALLVEVDGATTLAACEDALARAHLTLGLASIDAEATVASWLARGAPGARDRWEDPADHLIAGLEATLANGKHLAIRPAPRRAVGPDLVALVQGAGGRFARIDRAWLRVHPLGAARSRPHPLSWDRDPPLEAGEAALLDAIEHALREA